jgi:hypothetical protein
VSKRKRVKRRAAWAGLILRAAEPRTLTLRFAEGGAVEELVIPYVSFPSVLRLPYQATASEGSDLIMLNQGLQVFKR